MRTKKIWIALFAIGTLILGTFFLLIHTNKNQSYINKIFDIARKTRPAPLNKLKCMLLDYSVDNNIKKTIKNFLLQTRGLKIDIEDIKQLNGLQRAGLSGNPLFFIQDKQNNLKMVVKVFENPFNPAGYFIAELSGYQIASTINGKNFNIISAKAVGKAIIDGKTYGFLAISPAVGTNMQNLILKMLRCKPFSPERAAALRVAQHAFERLGKALAELHQIRVEKNVTVHHTLVERAKQNLNSAVTLLSEENHGINIEALKQYFEQLKKELVKVKTTRSLAHGDPNLGNFIYHEKNNVISIVDLARLHRAVDQDGNPIQNAAIDFMGVLNIISLNKAFGMNEEERITLATTFTNAYGSTPTELEQKFFALEQHLDVLNFFLKLKKTHAENFPDSITNKIIKFEIDVIKKVCGSKDWIELVEK